VGGTDLNITEMSDDWIDRLIQRYRDELDAIDRVDASEFEKLASYRRYLRSQIRMLEGERERRKHEDDEG
jgi:hypothetical protein